MANVERSSCRKTMPTTISAILQKAPSTMKEDWVTSLCSQSPVYEMPCPTSAESSTRSSWRDNHWHGVQRSRAVLHEAGGDGTTAGRFATWYIRSRLETSTAETARR